MLQDTAACRHAACRDHNRLVLRFRDAKRLLDRFDDGHARRVEDADLPLARCSVIEVGIELVQSFCIELERAGSHRAVDVDWQDRDTLLLFKTLDPINHFFGAANGERRNDDLATAIEGIVDDRVERGSVIVRRMDAIAIGRFDEEGVGARNWRGIRQDRPPVAAEVAAEDDGLSALVEARIRRPEQVAGVDELDVDAGHNRNRPVVADRLQQGQRPGRIERRVQRERRLVLRITAAIRVTRVFFLQVRGVGKDEGAQFASAWGAEDSSPEPVCDETGQIAAVIQMCMRQDDSVDASRVDRQRRPIAFTELLQPLKETAIDEHAMIAQVEQMLRSSDCSGSSEKRE